MSYSKIYVKNNKKYLYIVYIDEIASFLNDITHNETLRGKLKLCYQINL